MALIFSYIVQYSKEYAPVQLSTEEFYLQPSQLLVINPNDLVTFYHNLICTKVEKSQSVSDKITYKAVRGQLNTLLAIYNEDPHFN